MIFSMISSFAFFRQQKASHKKNEISKTEILKVCKEGCVILQFIFSAVFSIVPQNFGERVPTRLPSRLATFAPLCLPTNRVQWTTHCVVFCNNTSKFLLKIPTQLDFGLCCCMFGAQLGPSWTGILPNPPPQDQSTPCSNQGAGPPGSV